MTYTPSPLFSFDRQGDPFGGALSAVPGVPAVKSPFALSTEEELVKALDAFRASQNQSAGGSPQPNWASSLPPEPPPGAFDPQPTNTPGGSADAGAQSDAQQAALEDLVRLQERISSIPYLKEKIDLETQAAITRVDAFTKNALQKQQEVSRREIEKQKIAAWQNITTAQINQETAVATSLAQLAYLSNQPNAGVLSAMAPYSAAASNAFGKITVV
jgi:hypothetical protein